MVGKKFTRKLGAEVGNDVGLAVVGVAVGFAVVGVFVGLAVFPKEMSLNTGLSPVLNALPAPGDARTKDTRRIRYCPVPLRFNTDNSW